MKAEWQHFYDEKALFKALRTNCNVSDCENEPLDLELLTRDNPDADYIHWRYKIYDNDSGCCLGYTSKEVLDRLGIVPPRLNVYDPETKTWRRV